MPLAVLSCFPVPQMQRNSLSEIESLVLQLRRGIEGRICRMDGRMDGDRDARPVLAFLHPFPFTVYGNADLFAQVAPPSLFRRRMQEKKVVSWHAFPVLVLCCGVSLLFFFWGGGPSSNPTIQDRPFFGSNPTINLQKRQQE